MNKFIKVISDGIYSIVDRSQLSTLYPNTAFPDSFSGDKDYNLYPLDDEPLYTSDVFKKVVDLGPERVENTDRFRIKYEIVDLSVDEKTEVINKQWVRVREIRNALLGQSDWIVSKSSEKNEPVPANWQTYRQALRDVTLQQDPFNIVWPVLA